MQYIIQLYGETICHEDWMVHGNCDYYRFYYMKSGEAIYTDPTKVMPLKSNCLYIFPCNETYSISHNPKNPLNVLWFHVVFFAPHKINTAEIKIENNTFMYHLLNSLIYSVPTSRSVVEQLFQVLFDTVCSYLEIILNDKAVIGKALDHINNYLNLRITNKDLADLLGYSEKYFIRLFTKTMGIQPHKYVLRVKLSHAVKFLTEDMSINEIANKLGYSNMNNFSRSFKSYYGMCPTKYMSHYLHRP